MKQNKWKFFLSCVLATTLLSTLEPARLMAARFNAAMVVAVAAVAAVEEEAMQAVVVRVAAAESMLAAAVRVVVVVVGLMLVAVDFVAVAEFMLQPQMARESRAVEIQVTTTVYESAARESAVEPTAVYTFHR